MTHYSAAVEGVSVLRPSSPRARRKVVLSVFIEPLAMSKRSRHDRINDLLLETRSGHFQLLLAISDDARLNQNSGTRRRFQNH
jgi:hypothetical protein